MPRALMMEAMDAEARRRLEEADFANEELTALVAVTDEAISTLELPQLLDTLVRRLVRVMGADAGALDRKSTRLNSSH